VIAIIIFILMLAIGVPIVFVLGLVGLSQILASGETGFLMMIPARMFGGIDNFALVAIPAFILAGELMNAGGITDKLVEFGNLIVGRFRGGLGYANVIVSMLLAGSTGAAASEASAVGTVMIPAMKKAGYDKQFAAALTSTAATMGPIIPPSMPFIVYGFAGGVSVGALFLAGIIPGILVGLSLMVMVGFLSWRRKYPIWKVKYNFNQMMGLFGHALISLSVPVIILGGIITGVFTPSEAACIAVFVALVIAGLIYRRLSFKLLGELLLTTGVRTAVILLVVATASVFGWVLAAKNIPHQLGEWIFGLSTNKYVLLLVLNLFLLFIGTFMDSLASIIILTPIFLPVIQKAGIDPLHFGVIFVMNVVIGLNTPPVGVCLYVTSAVGDISLERLIRGIVPFFISMLASLLIVTYVPPVSLWIPRLLMP